MLILLNDGLCKEITSIKHAVVVLGLRTVINLVTGVAIKRTSPADLSVLLKSVGKPPAMWPMLVSNWPAITF
ncbi:MAG TPA: hypothetical protein DCZ03_12495 [Gammaproteobacteria bacterium]|nr:hypothetical protein [Gammaproteobacteria bacterium]